MGKLYAGLEPSLRDWLGQQRMFFVATAPLAADGLVNCSPKGMDTFTVLGPREVAYLDLTGSGIETIAHLRENRRIVFMFAALSGPPTPYRATSIRESGIRWCADTLQGRGCAGSVPHREEQSQSRRLARTRRFLDTRHCKVDRSSVR
jgi:hypothetical protein